MWREQIFSFVTIWILCSFFFIKRAWVPGLPTASGVWPLHVMNSSNHSPKISKRRAFFEFYYLQGDDLLLSILSRISVISQNSGRFLKKTRKSGNLAITHTFIRFWWKLGSKDKSRQIDFEKIGVRGTFSSPPSLIKAWLKVSRGVRSPIFRKSRM